MSQLLLALTIWQRLGSVPLAYLLLWCLLAALSVTIIVLLRAGWGQNRPLQKCAVLSLLVHFVFACLAMTVRIVVGDGTGNFSGPPIRVRIVSEESGPVAMAPVADELATNLAAPKLLAPAPEPDPQELVDAEPVTPDEPEPADQAAAEPIAEPVPVAQETHVDVEEPPIDPAAAVNDPQQRQLPPPEEAQAQQPVMPEDVPPAAASVSRGSPVVAPSGVTGDAAGDTYALRNNLGRLGLIEWQGGNAQTEAAVSAALAWLAAAQSPDGRWDADRFGAGREMAVMGQDRYGAGRNADTGISALALLAFLGAGHSHLQGDYQPVVRRGLDFLSRTQSTDGSIFGDAELFAQMYCHSMATFALAEASAMTGDKRYQSAVARATNFCIRAQNPSTGGWRYRLGDSGDTSQLGWQMMALASAERAGMEVPNQTWTNVDRFLGSVRRGNYGGLASYRPDSPASTSMTAEALYCRLLLSAKQSTALDERSAGEATGQLLRMLPDAERVNLYYWYYATLALHHRQTANDQAAAAWHAWNDALIAVLLDRQVADGPDIGSWNTDCLWGGYGGRVYTTSMAAMCLEVYYRYAPESPRDPWVAVRPDDQLAR